jgi:hypothetical protein
MSGPVKVSTPADEVHGTSGAIQPDGTPSNLKARIGVRPVKISGTMEPGNAHRKDAEFIGDIYASSLIVEEGGYIKGKIDLTRQLAESPCDRETSPSGRCGLSESPDMRELSHCWDPNGYQLHSALVAKLVDPDHSE